MEGNIWHPYTQMQTAPTPLMVERAEGAWLYLADGRRIFDAISSWWVTVHGHSHPHIAKAIGEQANTLEQVIFAGFSHPQAEKLAARLVNKLPSNQSKVFFSDDGSTAVEVGLKMALQYWQNKGEARNTIACLDGAYHGDTFGAMSVSARSTFTQAFVRQLFQVASIPSPADASLSDCLQALDRAHAENALAALVVEPLVQGAGGMKMYAKEDLEGLLDWCKRHAVLAIFDEVMTGFYRTGKLFASLWLQQQPDIICLSKGLTGGFLPLAVTTCTDEVFEAFLSNEKSKMFFHGHSFTANPIGCAAANASLDLFEMEAVQAQIAIISRIQTAAVERFSRLGCVENVRSQGTILAMDIVGSEGYLAESGHKLAAKMLERGIFLRPLGNVVYLMPPYCCTAEDMGWLHQSLEECLALI